MLFTGCLKQSQALPFIYLLCMENTFCDQCMLIRNLIGLAYSDFPQESIIISSKSNIHHFNMWEILELAHREQTVKTLFLKFLHFDWLINLIISDSKYRTFFLCLQRKLLVSIEYYKLLLKKSFIKLKNFIRMEFSLKRKSWNEIPLFIY